MQLVIIFLLYTWLIKRSFKIVKNMVAIMYTKMNPKFILATLLASKWLSVQLLSLI